MPLTSLAECYKVLGLEPDASLSEVQAAYRDLAQVWHPDRFQNHSPRLRQRASDTLRDVIEAYRRIEESAKSGVPSPPPAPRRSPPPPKRTRLATNIGVYSLVLLPTLVGGLVMWWWVASRKTDQPTPAQEEPVVQPASPALAAGEKPAPRRQAGTTPAREQAPEPAVAMDFAQVPAGEFRMGSNSAKADEMPVHRLSISRSFQLGRYEVTQAQWQAVMGDNPSLFKSPDRPVERVSWHDAQEFLKRMTARGVGYGYRLPTEAEWEYAARAAGEWDPRSLNAVAWHDQNSRNQTHPVGQKPPNPWGLQDILGNVFEWCEDIYGEDYYVLSPAVDPAGASAGPYRVVRGGSFLTAPWGMSVASRRGVAPASRFSSIGFRCVREPVP